MGWSQLVEYLGVLFKGAWASFYGPQLLKFSAQERDTMKVLFLKHK